jgi:hypothetical protein
LQGIGHRKFAFAELQLAGIAILAPPGNLLIEIGKRPPARRDPRKRAGYCRPPTTKATRDFTQHIHPVLVLH